ncbi:alpha/beta-hydrolase [Sodiomyces alkalinus F11]|uniref:Kynurenine formamidase n=1 Tax=Sodiomyces alkalinus (strain CBS 110278 / VKM F-3762 / F11) TaxID=1314773 RepID=A0A3N2Q282_SODAK|nr:alpha/beta-hydrolase [Sodiomyces alkalinus F11]ROT40860.1 alpha/beta-hydrolase [Sodiomyces alkalinus F11]
MADEALIYSEHHYGEHELQRVGVWEFPEGHQHDDEGHWIIFIHGGAWRDPQQLLTAFTPSIRAMLRSAPAVAKGVDRPSRIAGFASIDYRLSPHPQFPQDPSSVPPTKLRNARHPDHLLDVRAALTFLQRRFPSIADRYVLVGHSAGATLAYQLLMGSAALGPRAAEAERDSAAPLLPAVFIGVSGIYELRDFNERHARNYTSFITAAFGEDEAGWNASMPTCYSGNFNERLGSSRRAVLARSSEDTLVDEPEIDRMANKLRGDGVPVEVVKTLTGDHDFIWKDGTQVAQLVEAALHNLKPPVFS